MGFIRPLTDKGGHLRTTRLPVKAHFIMMLLTCSAPEEIWPRNEDLRPRRYYDSASTCIETTWTTFIKQTTHGEDTEGVKSQVPSLNPTIPVPRVPPDPSGTRIDCRQPFRPRLHYGTPPSPRSTKVKQSMHGEDMEGAATSYLLSPTTIPFSRVPPDPSPTTINPPSFSPERKHDKPLVRERILQRNAKQLPIDEDAEGMVSKVSSLTNT